MNKKILYDEEFDWKPFRDKSDLRYAETYSDGIIERIKPHCIINKGELEIKFALALARLYFNTIPMGRALDVGCGWGYITNCLKKAGFEVMGFDISEEAIMLAKKSFPKISFFIGNGTKPKKYFNQPQFDLIYIREFHPFTRIDDFDYQIKIIEDYIDLLNKNGIIIISHSRKTKIKGSTNKSLDYVKVRQHFNGSNIETAGPFHSSLFKKLRMKPYNKLWVRTIHYLTEVISVIIYHIKGGGLIEVFLLYNRIGK